ncbi:hypothetical protein GCG54_00005185 [Colletotrichum gloeosporioides]|uniref:Rhodopsin domain-containing protein n=1 Tax=Colletotrichum gloeosporioides TaxID=474922 RepID=A0A8H4FLZ7_COLGL|nr:uncharacterized protein GCG54_00005185 [Colletotrichum gloeosporioides]KAF3805819.1 hypothetical protein GCG54_00005185 [Colletotrichum gloeosporioides]
MVWTSVEVAKSSSIADMRPLRVTYPDSGLPGSSLSTVRRKMNLNEAREFQAVAPALGDIITCLLVESIITQLGINLGFGRHFYDVNPQTNLLTIAMYTSIGASISCFASTGSKVGFGVTLLRLTSGWSRGFVWFAVVTLTLVMLPSATLTWLKCTPIQKNFNRQMEGTCWDESITLNYGIFNAAWCAAMDFLLALVPWKLIWGMRMRKHEKLGICVAMSLGWLSGVCAITKGVYLVQLEQGDFFFNGMDVTIWTAVETATAIVASSIPVLRVFFREKASTLGYEKSNNENSNDVVLNTYHTRVVDLSVATDTSKPPDENAKEAKADETRRNTILPEIREFEPLYDEIMREKCFDVESQNGSRKDEITEKNDMSA